MTNIIKEVKVLNIDEIRIIKKISIIGINKNGIESEIGLIIYNRNIEKNSYFIKPFEGNEEDLIKKLAYPTEDDFPSDEFDKLIFQSIAEIHPNSTVKTDLLFTTSDLEHLLRLTSLPKEKCSFTVCETIDYSNLNQYAGKTLRTKHKTLNIYTNNPLSLPSKLSFSARIQPNRIQDVFMKIDQVNFY